MLFGNTQQLEMIPFVKPIVHSAITQTMELVHAGLTGKQLIGSTGVFVIITDTETKPFEKCNAEIHKNYIDVQVILKGSETIGYSNNLSAGAKALTELENDVMFFEEVEGENFVVLNENDFGIFYPNQLHRPLIATLGKDNKVSKAIIKIPYELTLA